MKSTLNLIDNKFLIVVTSIVICSFAFCDPRMEIAVSDIDKTVESYRSYAMERLKICEKNNGIFDHLEMLKEFIVQYEKTATDPDNENALLCPVVDFSLKNIEISQTTDNMSFKLHQQNGNTRSFLKLPPLCGLQVMGSALYKDSDAEVSRMIKKSDLSQYADVKVSDSDYDFAFSTTNAGHSALGRQQKKDDNSDD